MSGFSTQNSARRIVQDKPSWKSRQLDIGNRHRTTLNFGDLVPAFWSLVQPGDKIKADATILAKFLPLIAPVFSRMKIRSEWFYVPLKQISPPTLRALQDFKPSDAASVFSQLLQTGEMSYVPSASDNQQETIKKGFPSVPAWWISLWNSYSTCTSFRSGSTAHQSGDVFFNGGLALKHWRTQSTVNTSDLSLIADKLGYEDFVSYSSKYRCNKLLGYLGLPLRLTTMRYTTDVLHIYSSAASDYDSFDGITFQDGSLVPHDSYGVRLSSSPVTFISDLHRELVFAEPVGDSASVDNDGIGFTPSSGNVVSVNVTSYPLLSSLLNPNISAVSGSGDSVTLNNSFPFYFPSITTDSSSLVSLLPMQAYQKIFNDFYRDEKLQPEEIRYYPDAIWVPGSSQLSSARDNFPYCFPPYAPYSMNNVSGISPMLSDPRCTNRCFNNLFGLRRRNRAKDVLSSCVTDKVLVNRLAGSSTAPNVFQSNLFSKVEKYLMKKEFTGSTWAEWLSNFFGVNSNDYLNNNVIFLGQKESTVSISENIQTSESTDSAAQGNRAGLAADFHNGDSIYFRVPDYGILMCIVSVIPDELDNFNGLPERFQLDSPYRFNLPDLQNIGFAPVFNRRANIGYVEHKVNLPNKVDTIFGSNNWWSNDVFGYQPFGYDWTYTPNIISGDFRTSLRYWHQSPDLDLDFTDSSNSIASSRWLSWVNGQLNLNANLPSIGLRFQPLSSSLAAQYYNNVFAVTNDESGDHIVADMQFYVTCHRNTAFFTDAIEDEK